MFDKLYPEVKKGPEEMDVKTWLEHHENGTGRSIGQRPDDNGVYWLVVAITIDVETMKEAIFKVRCP